MVFIYFIDSTLGVYNFHRIMLFKDECSRYYVLAKKNLTSIITPKGSKRDERKKFGKPKSFQLRKNLGKQKPEDMDYIIGC